MRYKNAKDVLPKELLAIIQQYTDGEYIYIPRKAGKRKQWGESTNAKAETQERNDEIYMRYTSGKKVFELAAEYYLSEKSIQRIVTQYKKQK